MRWLRLIPGLLRLLAWWREWRSPSGPSRVVLMAEFPSSLMDDLERELAPTEMLVLDPEERIKLRLAILQLERLAGTSIALHSFHASSKNHS